jgi:hypothetical protein
VERGILRLTQRLQFLLAQKEDHWLELSSLAALSANCLIHTNGFSPFELMFGRKISLNESIKDIDLNFDLPSNDKEYLQNLKQRFQEASEICKDIEISDKKAQIAKHRTNVKTIKGLEIFDLVYIYSPRAATYMHTHSIKLSFKKIGPVVIESIFNERVYKVRTLNNQPVLMIFHSNRVEPAHLLVGEILVGNLITLIAEIKKQGAKGKEEIINKLKETEQSIIEANKMDDNKGIENVSIIRNKINDEKVKDNNCSCTITSEINDSIEGQIDKLKWSKGQLYALISLQDHKLKNWQSISDFPNEIIEQVMKNKKLRTVGSIKKYRKQLGLM